MYTSKEIDDAIAQGISQRLSFGKGLYLRISPASTATWTIKLKKHGKCFNHSAGHYPDLTLTQAREIVEAFASQISIREDNTNYYTLKMLIMTGPRKRKKPADHFQAWPFV